MNNFDTERFILEIQSRPALWDTQSAQYANKIEKAKAWEEICRLFYENFDGTESQEKNESCKILQKKWKSLRDSFSREINLQKGEVKSGSARKNRRRYVYFDLLYFLKTNMAERNTASNLDEHEIEEGVYEREGDENEDLQSQSQDIQEEQNSNNQINTKSRPQAENRKRGLASVQTAEIKLMNEMTKRLCRQSNNEPLQKEESDEDRHFLLSLLKDLKRIPEENKLDAKSELMMVLKKWRQPSHDMQTGSTNQERGVRPYEATTSMVHTYRTDQQYQETQHHSLIPTRANSTQQPVPSPAASECSRDTSYSYMSDYF